MTRPPTIRFAHQAMACDFEAILSADDPSYARQAADAAFAEIDRLEAELSRFIPTSDISRINSAPLHRATLVSLTTMECLKLSRTIYDRTRSAFDITIGRLLLPTHQNPPIGMNHLQIDVANRTVARLADVCVDLGAIGKGYALDAAALVFIEWGLGSMLLHAAQSTALAIGDGEVALHLRDPQNHDVVLDQVKLKNQSLSGSGRLLHGDHIINPRTGAAATDYLATWAMAPTAAASDALSTAFMSMSLSEIASFVGSSPGIGAAVMDCHRSLHRWGL